MYVGDAMTRELRLRDPVDEGAHRRRLPVEQLPRNSREIDVERGVLVHAGSRRHLGDAPGDVEGARLRLRIADDDGDGGGHRNLSTSTVW